MLILSAQSPRTSYPINPEAVFPGYRPVYPPFFRSHKSSIPAAFRGSAIGISLSHAGLA